MSFIVEILVTLLILSVLVTGHEFGHFFAGKLLNFDIEEFSVGMGPKLCGIHKNGIDYNLRSFPIGGMCRFFGEDETPESSNAFRAKAPWKRAIVVAAGPFMNFVMAFILCLVLFWGCGLYDYSRVVVNSVDMGGPADSVGMRPGDEIVSINGKEVDSYEGLRALLDESDPAGFQVEVMRDRERIPLTLQNTFNEEENAVMMGITISYARVRCGFKQGIENSIAYCGQMSSVIFDSLKMLFNGQAGINDMSGVVGVTRIVGEAVELGFASVLSISIMLSVNLGIVNLLPIPALDGGRLLFIIVEWVRGKPIPAEKEGIVHFVGMVLLLGLMAYLVFHDVIVWIGG